MSNSGSSTPRFTAQAASTEELLKNQTVGLVHLEDFRKRRRDAEDVYADSSGTVTPRAGASDIDTNGTKKKKRQKTVGRKLLSFDNDSEDVSQSPKVPLEASAQVPVDDLETPQPGIKRKFRSNPNAGILAPKAVTKATLAAETAERDRLRTEFVKIQEQVRDAVIAIPFVFYDGASLPGGTVKVKKGEHIWLFLERCRKLGAEIGVSSEGSTQGSGSKQRVDGKKSWARIGVDDLMLVRGGIIIPHHYEFHYFISNKIADPGQPERLLFNYSDMPTTADGGSQQTLLRRPGDEKLEGEDGDPSYTKVVDRRWYEKNKHIYPASLWREYKTGKEYEELLKGRRDAQGNSFFFA